MFAEGSGWDVEKKGKRALFSYENRAEILASCSFVDEVFPEINWDQKQIDIQKYNVDIFAIGDDWAGKFDFLSDFTDVVYLPRTSDISTTEIKQVVSSIRDEKLFELKNSIEHTLELVRQL